MPAHRAMRARAIRGCHLGDARGVLDPADGFYLDLVSQGSIGRVPTDGRAFTVGCRTDYEGCELTTAASLELETTDTPVDRFDSLRFPAATSKSVRVRCLVPNAISVTVPTQDMQLIQRSGATRVRVSFRKSRVAEPEIDGGSALVLVGHGYEAFTTP